MDDSMDDVKQRFVDNKDGTFSVQTFQDVSSYLRNNEEMYNYNQLNKNSESWKKDHALGWHRASIPMVIVHKWLKEFQALNKLEHTPRIVDPEFKVFMYKKIQDPEYRKLRVDGRTDKWRPVIQ